jgi:predicted nicotinamide N-methyase
VIDNCKVNLERNEIVNGVVLQLDWRWFETGQPISAVGKSKTLFDIEYETIVTNREIMAEELKRKFDIIIAADCIFSFTHSRLIPLVIKEFLSPGGCFHVLVPQRELFQSEIEKWEKGMDEELHLMDAEEIVRVGRRYKYYKYIHK